GGGRARRRRRSAGGGGTRPCPRSSDDRRQRRLVAPGLAAPGPAPPSLEVRSRLGSFRCARLRRSIFPPEPGTSVAERISMTVAGQSTRGALAAVALAVLVAACGSGQAAQHPAASPGGHSAASPAAISPPPSGPATRLVSYPVRVGPYRLVDKKDHPVATTTKDRKFLQSFSFAATARYGLYMPGHQARQNVLLIAGRLAQGVSPATAIQ